MKRFLLHISSLVLALFLALVLVDVVGVVPTGQPPIVCPDGAVAYWSTVRHELWNEDLPNLSCRDAEGRPHGPNFNWSDGHLLGMSFWEHGKQVGATVTFHENRRVWTLGDSTADSPYSITWTESGVKQFEEIQHGEITRFSIWYPNGALKFSAAETGESDPYWLPDGSFNEGREDASVFVGEFRSYFENGNPKDMGSYRNGARDGEWTCSDESGQHTVFATFAEGRLLSRTGDTDVEHMKDRCRHGGCGRPRPTDAEPDVASEEGRGAKPGCSSRVG